MSRDFSSTIPTLYLYSRVSTDKQTQNRKTGVRRQTESEGVEKVLKLFPGMPIVRLNDHGKSAHKGLNTSKKGELGQFIHQCMNGQVFPESIIAMEELDRFTRLGLTQAQSLVNSVLHSDVHIYTWQEDKTYYKDDMGDAFQIILQLEGAHQYSKKLSRRVTESAIDTIKRIESGERDIDDHCPAIRGYGNNKWWVDTSSGYVKPHGEYWDIAEEMIELVLSGMGHMKMREYLTKKYPNAPTTAHNKEKTGWGENITRVFHSSETLLGIKRVTIKHKVKTKGSAIEKIIEKEHVIENYYPPLCDLEIFNKMAAEKQKNRVNNKPGKAVGIFTNLGICRCSTCNQTINAFRSNCGAEKETLRYKCTGQSAKTTDCNSGTINSVEVETAIIKMIGIAIMQPDPKINNDEELKIELQLKDIETKLIRGTTALLELDYSSHLIESVAKLERQKSQLESRLSEIHLNKVEKVKPEKIFEIPPHVLDYTKNEAREVLKEKIRNTTKEISIDIGKQRTPTLIKVVLKNGLKIEAVLIGKKLIKYLNTDHFFNTDDHGGVEAMWLAESWFGIDRKGVEIRIPSDEYS